MAHRKATRQIAPCSGLLRKWDLIVNAPRHITLHGNTKIDPKTASDTRHSLGLVADGHFDQESLTAFLIATQEIAPKWSLTRELGDSIAHPIRALIPSSGEKAASAMAVTDLQALSAV